MLQVYFQNCFLRGKRGGKRRTTKFSVDLLAQSMCSKKINRQNQKLKWIKSKNVIFLGWDKERPLENSQICRLYIPLSKRKKNFWAKPVPWPLYSSQHGTFNAQIFPPSMDKSCFHCFVWNLWLNSVIWR